MGDNPRPECTGGAKQGAINYWLYYRPTLAKKKLWIRCSLKKFWLLLNGFRLPASKRIKLRRKKYFPTCASSYVHSCISWYFHFFTSYFTQQKIVAFKLDRVQNLWVYLSLVLLLCNEGGLAPEGSLINAGPFKLLLSFYFLRIRSESAKLTYINLFIVVGWWSASLKRLDFSSCSRTRQHCYQSQITGQGKVRV